MSNTTVQTLLDTNVIDEASLVAVHTLRICEIIDVLINANKQDGDSDFIFQLKTLLYGLSFRADQLNNALIKAGYGHNLYCASNRIEVL